MNTPLKGTGKLTTAVREAQDAARRSQPLRTDNALVDQHPLGSTVRPTGNGTAARRQTKSSPNVPRYG